MIISGFQRFSLIDYPGKICAIIFTQGCNFRCPYCHNPELVKPELFITKISEKEVFLFLEKRKGKLDAVEITGGEPTLQPNLFEFIKKIKDMGFLVKLDSNGANPQIIKKAIKNKLVDYIAMDIKTKLKEGEYNKAIGVEVDINKIKQSISIIKESGINYEFRTTVVPTIIGEKELIEIAKELKGSKKYILQQFSNKREMINPHFQKIKPYSEKILKKFLSLVRPYFKEVELRI